MNLPNSCNLKYVETSVINFEKMNIYFCVKTVVKLGETTKEFNSIASMY